MFDQSLVSFGFVEMPACAESPVGYAPIEEEMQRIPVESDPFPCLAKCRQQAGREETLYVHDSVISPASDGTQQSREVLQLPVTLVPDQHLPQVRMPLEQGFIPFSDEEIYGCIGVVVTQFFDQRSGQDDITYEGGLYDKEGSRHGTKVRCLWRTDPRGDGSLRRQSPIFAKTFFRWI